MDNAFRYVINNGLTLSSLYPFSSTSSTISSSCKYSRLTMPSYSIKSSKIIFNDCSALKAQLLSRPVTVVISADIGFVFYSSGVLNRCGERINHAIQLVGYFKNATNSYYIGRNSWGVSWGMQGDVEIDAEVEDGNLCNVCTYPQYVE